MGKQQITTRRPAPAPARPVEPDPFADYPEPYPRTLRSEAELLQAARELLSCSSCSRALAGDDGRPCGEQRFVRGCIHWRRRSSR